MKKFSLFMIVLTLTFVVSGCTKQTTPTMEPTASAMPAEAGGMDGAMGGEMEMKGEQHMEASGAAGEVITSQDAQTKVLMNAQNFTFGVSKVTVKKGSKLVFAVTNDQGFHDLKIDELKVNSGSIPEGKTVELDIPTDMVGEFEYYCSVGQHRQMGMRGTLVVEE